MDLFETCSVGRAYRSAGQADVWAVKDVSLVIERGSFTVLAGPSGSGKTTLLGLLGALERPTRGQVVFDGKDLGKCSDHELARMRRRMGFVFQDSALIGGLSAADNIGYPLIPRGVSTAERRRRAQALLASIGLADKLDQPAWTLSGGERQRVAVARALAGEPEVLLADEATASVDPETGRSLLATLRKRHVEGMTVVFATHDASVLGLATRVIALQGGALQIPG